MSKLQVQATALRGLAVAASNVFTDERGAFTRFFCAEELAPVLGSRQVVQINHSLTRVLGAVRGLHFQHPPHAEMKLVRCLRGAAWDVAVDLRAGSSTFLQWHAEQLTATNARMMIIPEGFAHGFQTLEPDTELLYAHTALYAPASEGGCHPADPRLGVTWPRKVSGLSERDASRPFLPASFDGLRL